MKIKIINIGLILIAILLIATTYYQQQWVDEFGDIDSCCSGLCCRCPPSFWECSFMMWSQVLIMMISIGLIMIGVVDTIVSEKS